MSFSAAAKLALSNIYLRMGSSAVFSPTSGPDVPCIVIVDRVVGYEPGSIGRSATVTKISYKRADIDRRVVAGETFTIDGDVYTVRAMDNYDDGAWTDYEGRAVVVAT
jgi:hypothetical protein